MNTINLFGRLTAEPELKSTQSGNKYVTFCMAVDRRTKEKATDFIDCIAWNKLAEVMSNYCHKGNQISLTGSLYTSTYESNGAKKKSYVVNAMSIDLVGGAERSEAQKPDDHLQFEPNFEVKEGELPFSI